MSRALTKQQTREALVAAAAAELARSGLDASLDTICARAGFTRGAFYVHFRDRDELIVAVVDRLLSRFQDALFAGDGADLEQTIARYVAAVVAGDGVALGSPAWRFRHTLAACARIPALRARYVALQQRAIERLVTAIVAGQRAGTVRRDVDARAAAELLLTLTLGLSVIGELRVPTDVVAGAAVLRRMLAPKPRRRRRRA
jgi:TetR/AcrR family transcriptional repressor of nem operon